MSGISALRKQHFLIKHVTQSQDLECEGCFVVHVPVFARTLYTTCGELFTVVKETT